MRKEKKWVSPKPNPGSAEAVKQGCQCPIIDNGHGHGYKGCEGVFVINGDCPLHGQKRRKERS